MKKQNKKQSNTKAKRLLNRPKVLTFLNFLIVIGGLIVNGIKFALDYIYKLLESAYHYCFQKYNLYKKRFSKLSAKYIRQLVTYKKMLMKTAGLFVKSKKKLYKKKKNELKKVNFPKITVPRNLPNFSNPLNLDMAKVFKLFKWSKTPKKKAKSSKTKKSTKTTKRTFSYFNFSAYKPTLIFISGILVGLLFIALPLQASSWFKQLPRPELLTQDQPKTTKILDRKGRLLYEVYVDKKYEPVELEQIPQHVVQATLAIEDSTFYDHSGIRLDSILRAVKANLFDERLEGGSTITQQLIKNVLLSPERTFTRKAKEAVLALMVEQKYTKNEILELYFNNIPYGGTAWGIQSASHKFFGKDVSDLSLAEATLLAGLPSAPSVYSPLTGNEELAKSRQRQVLGRMVELGYITKSTADAAYNEKLTYVPQAEYIRAPHFVTYVREELVAKYGERYVDFGGLTVTTTLDLDLQDKVQTIVSEEVAKNEALNISNGAALVLDSRTAEILAYVGSRDYFADDDGAYDVIRAFRQPGSSIKPLTYVLALENGATPATIIDDSPLTIQSYGQTWSPKNYDGKYHGKVTLRQALANSYNIPAVKLVRTVGADNMVALGRDLGLQKWEVGNTYGLSVTLGGKEVRLLDLTNAYATFARQGEYRDVIPLVSVKDSNGFEIFSDERESTQVLTAGATYLISNILSDNNARTPAFGPNSSLVVPQHTVAVKTGTTDQNRDNLTLGYTPSYAVGVWVGNNDNEPMNSRLVSGLSGAAPIWNRVMTTVLENKTDEAFARPNSVFVKIDEECDNRSEVFIRGTAPRNLCPKDKETADSES